MENEPKTILIVEDEPEVASMLKMRLESAGHKTALAENGLDALDKVKKQCPDLIITDVLMPKMDGFQLYKELKNSKATATIPVLVLTARGKMEDSFSVLGVDDFIAKPFDSQTLLEKVKVLLGRTKTTVKAKEGIRILLAGDATEVVENMSMQLRKAGCHTDMVTTGPQVISKVVLFLPQILIMEVQMDEMTSSEVIKVIRQMPQTAEIPILVYSFYRTSELGSEDVRQKALSVGADQDNCMEAGATEYLGRFNENTFLKTMEKYLK